MRLNRYIAHAGLCSRRAADKLIQDGKVKVNGNIVKDYSTQILETDIVLIEGKRISLESSKVVYALYKPVGYVSTVFDKHAPFTVLDLIQSPYRIYPVGRLDKDSEGLILLTNDGDLANQLTHPKHQIEKTYEVWVEPPLSSEQLNQFRSGVLIDGSKTAPAEIDLLKQKGTYALYKIIIREGRNRQIRKMISKLGSKVTRLKRVAMGPIQLGDLKVGTYRQLTKQELQFFEQLEKGIK